MECHFLFRRKEQDHNLSDYPNIILHTSNPIYLSNKNHFKNIKITIILLFTTNKYFKQSIYKIYKITLKKI